MDGQGKGDWAEYGQTGEGQTGPDLGTETPTQGWADSWTAVQTGPGEGTEKLAGEESDRWALGRWGDGWTEENPGSGQICGGGGDH